MFQHSQNGTPLGQVGRVGRQAEKKKFAPVLKSAQTGSWATANGLVMIVDHFLGLLASLELRVPFRHPNVKYIGRVWHGRLSNRPQIEKIKSSQ
jgi:hypothetical protein